MLYRISVTERGLTGIANIFRSRLSRLDDLLRAGTVPLMYRVIHEYLNFGRRPSTLGDNRGKGGDAAPMLSITCQAPTRHR